MEYVVKRIFEINKQLNMSDLESEEPTDQQGQG